ncbi:hypothetical protein IV203_017815 [Nitzschia inconspicua]|uniref:Uncharacterized protein n=1 Tax=Nitzschia inconspicua TaxID=303405 RepID=A0A9K3M088_9STRA|nr:hypothetical protein IV203_017815 [Nitzschia inconspicua]
MISSLHVSMVWSRRVSAVFLFLLIIGTFVESNVTDTVTVGDVICIEGYVMDRYCIDNVRLLDNPREETLKRPDLHTVHCLVDVGICRNSFFEILTPPPPGSDTYGVGWRLKEDDPDEAGISSKDKIIQLARKVGDPENWCSTCEDGGMEQEGFRATIRARVEALATAGAPPIVSVMEAHSSSIVNPNTLESTLVAQSPCQHFFGIPEFPEMTSTPTSQPSLTLPATTITPTLVAISSPIPSPTVTTVPTPERTVAALSSDFPSDMPSDMPSEFPSSSPSLVQLALSTEKEEAGRTSLEPISSASLGTGVSTTPESDEFPADNSAASVLTSSSYLAKVTTAAAVVLALVF